MKKTYLFLIVLILFIIFTGCQAIQEDGFVSGPGDMEPPHFESEKKLAEYLSKLEGEEKTDCYYRLVTIPDTLEFDSYSSYFSYVDWWYRNPGISEETRFIYLRWYFLGDGNEWLENDLINNGSERVKLQAAEKTYYYLLVDEPDTGWPKIYDIEWIQDGYLFGMSIPEGYIAPNGTLDEILLEKYTELDKISIDE